MRFHRVSEPGPAQDEAGLHPWASAERLIERFAPEAMAHGRHEVLIRAPADLVFEKAEGFDLLSIPSVHAIFRLRARLLGARPPRRPALTRFRTAVAFGRRFRIYSIATVSLSFAFGMWTSRMAPGVEADLPTPWAGFIERASIWVFLAWIVVFAVALLRDSVRGPPPTCVGKADDP